LTRMSRYFSFDSISFRIFLWTRQHHDSPGKNAI
jgi:hypothetical protein